MMKTEVGTWRTIRPKVGSCQSVLVLELRVVVTKSVGTGGGSRKHPGSLKNNLWNPKEILGHLLVAMVVKF
jgi:hypothetical protein